jgi:dolichol-phosphate mannosyltransferase
MEQGSSQPEHRTLVVIPTYNEAENVRPLAEGLLGLDARVDVLVVDDNSPDGTGDVGDAIAAENPRFQILHRTQNRGYAPSSKEGLRWGLERGYDILCTMDADLSHDPAVLPSLLARLDAGADLAIGSRYVDGGGLKVDWGPLRLAVSKVGSSYARMMIGTPVHDCTSGYRAYRASMLSGVDFADLHSDGYAFLIELLAAFARLGARVEESPIVYIDRQRGASKISKRIIFEALLETTGLGIRRALGR